MEGSLLLSSPRYLGLRTYRIWQRRPRGCSKLFTRSRPQGYNTSSLFFSLSLALSFSSSPPSTLTHSHSIATTADPLLVNYEVLSKETPEGWLKFFAKELKSYATTIFFTNGGMQDPVRDRVGDILADYVDAGNAVIIGVFANASRGSPISMPSKKTQLRHPPRPLHTTPKPIGEIPGGRWEKEDYGPILSAAQSGGNLTMGKKLIPDHPILRNVHSISCFYNTSGDVHPKATRIANLSNGTPLVAEREFPGGGVVVSVNIFLPSEKSGDGGWRRGSSNHVDILLSNICNYLMSSIPRRRRGEKMPSFESHSTILEAEVPCGEEEGVQKKHVKK